MQCPQSGQTRIFAIAMMKALTSCGNIRTFDEAMAEIRRGGKSELNDKRRAGHLFLMFRQHFIVYKGDM